MLTVRMNDEFEINLEGSGHGLFEVTYGHLPVEGLITPRNHSQDGQYLGRDSKQASPGCESTALLLRQRSWFKQLKFYCSYLKFVVLQVLSHIYD
jgi:hypothetical protein